MSSYNAINVLGWVLGFRYVRFVLAAIVLTILLGVVSSSLASAVLGPGHGGASALFVLLVYVAAALLLIYLWLWQQQRRRFRVRTFGELLALTPAQFEVAVGDLLHDLGHRDVRRVGGSGDLAADLWCRDPNGQSVVVQCKRYAPGVRVGSPDIQTFIGMVSVHHRADSGIFVTTSTFTQPAVRLARQHGIWLIDGNDLVGLVERVYGRDSGQDQTRRGGAQW